MAIRYYPNTIIPTDQEGLIKYLQEELDKIAFTLANLAIPEAVDPVDPELPAPVGSHEDLSGRDNADQHTIGSITGLAFDQQRQDLLIDANTKVFFQPTEPDASEASQGDLWFKEGYE